MDAVERENLVVTAEYRAPIFGGLSIASRYTNCAVPANFHSQKDKAADMLREG
jgi:hypothetical protein